MTLKIVYTGRFIVVEFVLLRFSFRNYGVALRGSCEMNVNIEYLAFNIQLTQGRAHDPPLFNFHNPITHRRKPRKHLRIMPRNNVLNIRYHSFHPLHGFYISGRIERAAC